MEAKELTREEQLAVAEAMVEASKKRFKGLLTPETLFWGYLLLIVSLAVFVVTHCLNDIRGHFFWFAMPVLGIPVALVLGRRKSKGCNSRSRIDEMVNSLWIWTGIACALSTLLGQMAPPVVAMLIAVGFGASGSILRLKAVSWLALPLLLIAPLYVFLPTSWVGIEFAVFAALPMIILGHWLQNSQKQARR